jgi:hypothetical protein
MLGILVAPATPVKALSEIAVLDYYHSSGRVGVTLPNGNYIWPYYSSYNSLAYIRINQIDTAGNISEWSSSSLTTVGGSSNLIIYNLLKDQNGSIYLVGKSSGQFSGFTLAQSQGIFVAKYNSDGTRAWINPSTYSGYDPGSTIDKDGNVVVVMQDGAMQFTVKKISSAGSTTWTTNFAGTNASNYGDGKAVSTDITGNIYIAHSLGDGASRDDVLITTLNSSGSVTSSQSFSAGVDVLQFYGATLPSFSIGTFVATTSNGTFVFTVNTQGLLEESYLYSEDGNFALSSLSVGSEDELYIGGDNCGYYDDCHQRVIKFSGTSLLWDAYYKVSYYDAVMKEVHRVSEESDGSLTYSYRQLSPSNNVYRQTFPAPAVPQVVTSAASLSAANATISGSVEVGNLKTKVDCLVSPTSDFQTTQTVSAGSDLISDGTYQCQPTNLQLGTNYYYKTVAVNSLGTSTSTVKMVSIPNVPSTPSLQGSLTGRIASLSFAKPNDNGMPLQDFTLQRKFDSGSWSNLAALTPTAESTQNYLDVISQSDAGKVASYQVLATNSVGNSAYSNQVSLTLPTVPLAATSLTAVGGTSDITISWTAPSNATTSQPISISLQATSNGLTWVDFTPSTFPSTNSAVFDAGALGTGYRFRVKASNAFGESSWSTSSNLAQLTTSTPSSGNTTVIINTPEVVINTPAVTVYSPTVSVGAKLSATSLANGLGVAIPSKAKTTVAIAKSSKKFCKVSGGKVVGIKSGPCVATVTVQAPKPKKGKKPAPVKKSVTVQIS